MPIEIHVTVNHKIEFTHKLDPVMETLLARILAGSDNGPQLDRIERKLNQMSAETSALLKKIDDATTAIGARIQKLIDGSTDTELNAALQTEVDRLTALGADPSNPVPEVPPAA